MPLHNLGSTRPTLPANGSAWIAPSADVIGDVEVGNSVSIWFGAVIRADNTRIVIGDRSNIQDSVVLHSDPGFPLVIGSDVTVGHRAILHGCTIGNRVLIGMGAIILNGATIGDDCIVGAGALVTGGKAFPSGSLIVGSPAAFRRELLIRERAEIANNADIYVRNGIRFGKDLR